VVMPTSYTSDAILLMRGMHEVGYTPKAIMAQSAGFAEQSFIEAVGTLLDGAMSRSAFALDVAKARPAIPAVNALFKARSNKDLNDNTGREVTALLVLADAINRAGSTDPDKLHAALVATDVPGNQTIMPWKGIKFDETGQNTEASPVIQQFKDGKYHTIYPFDVASEPAVWNVGK
jgi:branched-chain amino acid transport system substrate-binding protein